MQRLVAFLAGTALSGIGAAIWSMFIFKKRQHQVNASVVEFFQEHDDRMTALERAWNDGEFLRTINDDDDE